MSAEAILSRAAKQAVVTRVRAQAYTCRPPSAVAPFCLRPYGHDRNQEQDPPQRYAELFYLQKQIQSQTPMALVLEDGEKIEGCIEWYDRNVLKLRGRAKILVYKSAIKYMYKAGEQGQ